MHCLVVYEFHEVLSLSHRFVAVKDTICFATYSDSKVVCKFVFSHMLNVLLITHTHTTLLVVWKIIVSVSMVLSVGVKVLWQYTNSVFDCHFVRVPCLVLGP